MHGELIGGWGVIFSRWSKRGSYSRGGGVIRGWGVIRGDTVRRLNSLLSYEVLFIGKQQKQNTEISHPVSWGYTILGYSQWGLYIRGITHETFSSEVKKCYLSPQTEQ